MRYNKSKKELRIILLFILVFLITIGYAFLNNTLNIIGTGIINNPTWDIHWENVLVKSGSVSASTPTIDTAKTTVNYSVTLTIPGDYYEFTVDAVNAGTIDGMVSVVSNKLNNVEITTLPNYLEYKVTYDDGMDIIPNHLLASGKSEKYKVHVGYKKDISSTDIPAFPQTLNLSFSVTYVQSDNNAKEHVTPVIKKVNGEDDKSDFRSDTYRDKIKIVNLSNSINAPSNVIESWDISQDQNESVMAFITQNSSDNTLYDLYIQGDGHLFANSDSSYLFYDLAKTEVINGLNILDTSMTTNMSSMFEYTGVNASSFNMDISNFDTSKVTNMTFMFSDFAYDASTWNIGDLSNWDVSNVVYMTGLFLYSGGASSTWNVGDLSNWDTSKVVDMSRMFESAGYNTNSWDIGDLSNWDVSNVTNMAHMFDCAGYVSDEWDIGNLSNWNVSNVTNMDSMFRFAGSAASTFNLGNLANWNVSNVTDMGAMFASSGESANTWNIGDLSNWDTSKVTSMSAMFQYAGNNATNWTSIGTLNVYCTYFSSMFRNSYKAKATLVLHNNPAYSSYYNQTFQNACTAAGSKITVNYTSAVTNIDNIIATKSSNSNVVKGSLIS